MLCIHFINPHFQQTSSIFTCNAKCHNRVLKLLQTVYATILVTVALLVNKTNKFMQYLVSNRTISQMFFSRVHIGWISSLVCRIHT